MGLQLVDEESNWEVDWLSRAVWVQVYEDARQCLSLFCELMSYRREYVELMIQDNISRPGSQPMI